MKNKGITLISLVITIIILMILTAITLGLVFGENGIIEIAKQAKKNYIDSQEQEEKDLENLYSSMLIATNDNSNITVNIEDLKEIIKKEIKEETKNIYPIGSIYISTQDINPKELFGGEWERYAEGRTLIGAGTGTDNNSTSMQFNVNQIGGEYVHQLTKDEIPAHEHTMRMYIDQNGYASITIPDKSAYYMWSTNGSKIFNLATTEMANKNLWTIGKTASTGSSQTHNNIQPYVVTYMWKRIS